MTNKIISELQDILSEYTFHSHNCNEPKYSPNGSKDWKCFCGGIREYKEVISNLKELMLAQVTNERDRIMKAGIKEFADMFKMTHANIMLQQEFEEIVRDRKTHGKK